METQEPNPPTPPVATPNAHFSGWQFAGLLAIAFLLGLGIGYVVWAYPMQNKIAALESEAKIAQSTLAAQASTDSTTATQSAQAASTLQIPQNVKRYDIPIGNNPTLGPANAPITLVEFSDYECPFCKKWYSEVLPQLQAKYGDKIRFVYRDFPLYDKHPDAEPAAEAADCAGEQNKYWQYHDLLFKGDALDAATYDSYAQQIGLNVTQFKQCVQDNRYQKDIQANFDFASNLGIQSTPTFFINGLALIGAQPFEVFDQVISLELAGKIPH